MMTQQDAEAWIERLVKIWVPDSPCGEYLRWDVDGAGILFEVLMFQGASEQVEVSIIDLHSWSRTLIETHRHYSISWHQVTEGHRRRALADLSYHPPEPEFHLIDLSADETYEGFKEQSRRVHEEFLAQWVPVFRRGLWLSGCPLEATAHEKTEWMQGFTREELQAWNLTT